MAINKTKVAQNAQKLVQKGQFEKAIKEYELLVKDDPKDLRSQLKIAELYTKLNQKVPAIQAFRKVADQYNKSGFYAKAVAVLRQAIDVDKEQVELYLFLAELQQKLGMVRDAVIQLNTAARLYQERGEHERALGVLERMRDIDGEDPSVLARYGEALFNAGQKDRAVEIFRSLVQTLKSAGNHDDLVRFCERILTINPDDVDILRELSSTYVRIGLANKALLKLKALFDRQVIDADLYDLLDRSYSILGKEDKAVHAQLEKARFLASKGDTAGARQAYELVQQRDPGNKDAEAWLNSQTPSSSSAAAPAPQAAPEPVKPAAAQPRPAPQAPPSRPTPASNPYGTASKQLSKYLTEADVYLKYGLRDKAIEQLESVLQHDPNNVSARSRLVDIYAEEQPTKAAQQLRALAEISEGLGEIEQARSFWDRAEALDPNGAADLSQSAGSQDDILIGGETESAEAEGDFLDEEEVEIEVDAEGDDDDVFVVEDDDDATVIGEADFGDLRSELDDELGADFLADDGTPAEEEVASVTAGAVVDDGSAEEELDEAEFYIQQNIFAEAQAILERVVSRFPNNAKAVERLAWVQEQQAEASPKSAAPVEPRTDGDSGDDEPLFDLAAELEAELDFGEEETVAEEDDVPSFEDIFTQFKKGVERELKDDTGAHYDLGIAYKEMGLVNDAIGEFEVAMAAPEREAECATMIALCYQQLGDNEKAVEYYRKGLESQSCSADNALNSNFELGCLFESMGDIRNAALHFKKVIEHDKNYRDVGERIRSLKARVQAGKAYA